MDSVLNRKTVVLKHQYIAAIICFIAVIFFLLWKVPFSYGFEDESFYLSFSHRLTMGDSLLADDWQLTQLSGFLLYIPVKVYMIIVGSTEGIVLFFRYLFVAFQSTVSIVIYSRLRKYGLFSILAAVIYCLHIPLTLFMALSYNSMGLAFVELTGLLMATTKHFSKTTFYMVGVFMACAVICNPVLVFVYLLYSICIIIYKVTKNKNHRTLEFSGTSFSFKTWFWITLGISTVSAIFFIFLFSRTNLKEIVSNFPMLFTDPAYQLTSKVQGQQSIFTLHKSLLIIIKFSPYLFSAYCVLMAVIAFDKMRITHRKFYIAIVSFIYLSYIVQIILSPVMDQSSMFWMFPLALLGLTCYFLSENKDKSIFAFLWILGLLYALCLDISSDFAPWSSTFGLAVSDTASVIIIKNIVDELREQYENQNQYNKNNIRKRVLSKTIAIILISSLFFQIGLEFYIDADLRRYSSEYFFDAYWPSTDNLNTIIEAGPLKGLKTTAHTVKLYNEIISDLDVIKEKGAGPVLITAYFPWCYLYLNMPYATYSTEIYNFTNSSQLSKYYKLHPEKSPKYIYVSKIANIFVQNMPDSNNKDFLHEKAEDIVPYFLKKYNCTVKESNVGYIIEIMK